ncbi:hypothetical protein PG994_009382 [Apiospora phragmitis]|uniref:Uncharacterized protein n=1 Tax=Apiospora phragmitis TaxID=2905665 RepID=A0ABR1UJ37_9PEZI
MNSLLLYDEFAIQGGYAYLMTSSGNLIERVALDGHSAGQIIAGSLNSALIAQPTLVYKSSRIHPCQMSIG